MEKQQDIMKDLEQNLSSLAMVLSPPCFVLALFYIDRLTSKHTDFYLCSSSVTR